MSNYKSDKQTPAVIKQRAGEIKTSNIKSSKYLPGVLQTELNEKWLDATLDQMISKGDLDVIDAFVGSRSSRHQQAHDVYLNTPTGAADSRQLEPAIITRDADRNVVTALGFDDITNRIQQEFSDYFYSAAYASDTYVYRPPVSEDKLVNFGQYYWAPDVPVYTTNNTGSVTFTVTQETDEFQFADNRAVTQVLINDVPATLDVDYTVVGNNTIKTTEPLPAATTITLVGAPVAYQVDFLTDVRRSAVWRLVDDQVNVDLQDGMLIKLGAGYDDSGLTYLVTSVGGKIHMVQYTAINPVTGQHTVRWQDATKYKPSSADYWDSSAVRQLSTVIGQSDLLSVIDDYNINPSAPFLRLFFGDTQKNEFVTHSMLVRLDSSWTGLNPDDLDVYRVWALDLQSDGTISATLVLDARAPAPDVVEQFIPDGLSAAHLLAITSLQGGWDTMTWDKKYSGNTTKDYLVIDRGDHLASAWSRVNHWVHQDTLRDIASMVPGTKLATYLSTARQAKRPIIEFKSGLQLLNGPANDGLTNEWKGPVDYILEYTSQVESMFNGSTYVLTNSPKIFRRETGVFRSDEIAIGTPCTIVTSGTTDFTQIGAADNLPGTVFIATGAAAGTGTVSGIARSIDVMNTNDTLLILDSFDEDLAQVFRAHDAYWDGSRIVSAQFKTKPNQPPLFVLVDSDGDRLDDLQKYPESNFRGNMLFAYQLNDISKQATWEQAVLGAVTAFTQQQMATSGRPDTELGLVLSYRDIGPRAEIVFENSQMTQRYRYTVSTHTGESVGTRREISGYYAYVRNAQNQFAYLAGGIPAAARTQEKFTATDYVYPFVTESFNAVADTLTYTSDLFLPDYPELKVFVEGVETQDFTISGHDITLVQQPPVGVDNIEIRTGYVKLPVGYQSFKAPQEYLVYSGAESGLQIDELCSDGVYRRTRIKNPLLTLVAGQTYRFYDLVGDATNPGNQLQFYLSDNSSITGPSVVRSDLNNDGFSETVLFTPSADLVGAVMYYGHQSIPGVARLIVVESLECVVHTVTVNGQTLNDSQYVLEPDAIYVPASIATVDSLIDLDYIPAVQPADVMQTAVPDVHASNSTNEFVTTFTINETISHWASVIQARSQFQGQAIGNNNSFKTMTLGNTAGTILMHQDISVMHDLNYGDSKLDIDTALIQQARDWWAFKLRFASQVRRLYTINSYSKVQDLVNDALDAIVVSRRGTALYADSNMVYSGTTKSQTITLDVAALGYTGEFSTKFTFNQDRTQADHVYVYLTENATVAGPGPDLPAGKFIERLLVSGVDYTITGSTITLLTTPVALGSQSPTVTVYWHDMDSESYVPQSLAKLGLRPVNAPRIDATELVGHDGDRYGCQADVELNDITSDAFDPITAALYELEKRVYAGFAQGQKYSNMLDFLPSQHHKTWYSLQTIDNYVERHFVQWNRNNATPLTPDNWYDVDDSSTWNYSTIDVGYYMTGNRLPGYWKGAYTILFGTYTPHLTPWEMLGMGVKPAWWDDHYPSPQVTNSWADPAKKNALYAALSRGLVSEPGQPVVQRMQLARHYWDWTNRSPVLANGTLQHRHLVLGTPDPVDAAQPYVYGDWGPVELNWRNSALGQAAMLSAVIKLNPTKAWSDFFQPGMVSAIGDSTNQMDVLSTNNALISPRGFQYPGSSVRYVKQINVLMSTDGWSADSTIRLLNGYTDVPAQATLDINDAGEITKVTLVARGSGYSEKPVVDIVNTDSESGAVAELEIVLGERTLTSNGVCQAQRNAAHRNNWAVDIEQQYYSIDTQLMQKLAGFSSPDLIGFYTESGPNGAFRVNENDMEMIMHSGTVREVNIASQIIITRSTTGFVISGISSGKQQFVFNQPLLTGKNDFVYVTLSDATTIKKYSRFADQPVMLEFGAVLNKIQDTYNFIRGYRNYLETQGFQFSNHTDDLAAEFAEWAVNSVTREQFIVPLGNSISYVSEFGHALEFDALPENTNSVLGADGNRIDSVRLSISRTRNQVDIAIKDSETQIGSVGVALMDYQHAVVFSNTTQFNQTMFNDVLNARQWRLRADGHRTTDWNGTRRAPGYLVFDNHIVKNFDSSVQYVDDYYRSDVDKFNPGIALAERLANGNIGQSWSDGLNLPNNTTSNFYRGVIRDKGTTSVVDRIGRSNIVDAATSTVAVYEEWMFHQGFFGDTVQTKSTEIKIPAELITGAPQLLELDDPAVVFVNKQQNFDFQVLNYTEYQQSNYPVLRTAGPLLDTDADYVATSVADLANIFDRTADYAVIPTWDSVTSYKLGDQVRHQGNLYSCAVSFVGFNPVATDLVFVGVKDNPVFEYASSQLGDTPSAVIDGTPIWFNSTSREYNNLVATGSVVDATVDSPANIVIDGVDIALAYQPDTLIVNVSAPEAGNPYITSVVDVPAQAFPDTAGKTLVINGITVAMFDINKPDDSYESYTGADIAPAPVVENFSGDGAQTDFVVATGLSPATYSITTVALDGAPQLLGTDYTVTGQTVAFLVPPADQSAIVITLTHAEILKSIFPVTQTLWDDELNNYVWTVSEVRVGGATQIADTDYTVNQLLNQVEFINPPGVGADVVFTINARHYLTISEAVDRINSAPGLELLTATLATDSRIKLVYDVQGNAQEQLVISAASANSDLGFLTGSYSPATLLAPTDQPMTSAIVAGLINASGRLPRAVKAGQTSDGRLVITKQATTETTNGTTLSITGSVRAAMGMPTSTSVTFTDVPVTSNAQQAAAIINAAGIPGITATVSGVYLQIASVNASVDLGSDTNSFNISAGISGGVFYRNNVAVENVFDEADWQLVTADPACFNIWLTNDSGMQTLTNTTDGIASKFNSWNVLQVQDFGYYTTDSDPGCSICAGTTSSDGNDARITLNAPHTLSVGDYVMLVNTTTKPNIDGIHQVTKLGGPGEENRFYIDRFIEKCGSAPHVFVLRNARFDALADMTASATSDYYQWAVGDRVFVQKIQGVPSNSVYEFNGTIFEQLTDRYKQNRVINTSLENMLIYNNIQKQTVVELELFDPVRGIIPGVADREVDFKGPIDQAVYTDSTDITFVGNERGAWGQAQVGMVWWNTDNTVYYDYDQGDNQYRISHWGKLFPGSTIDVYEWTQSSVPPDEWAAAVKSERNQFGVPATGAALSVLDPATNENVYYYTESSEWNDTLAKYETVYYFWVKDKTTVSATGRNLTAKQIAEIIQDPTASGITWCAVASSQSESDQYNNYSNSIILSNVGYYLSSDASVLQINKKTTNQAHSSWTVIAENRDEISDYWYTGVRDNLTGQQTDTKLKLPNIQLHEFNRYGDDRALGQCWFTDVLSARREAVTVANRLLKSMNLRQDLSTSWLESIGPGVYVSDIGQDQNTIPAWSASTVYQSDDQIVWNKKVYRAVVAHTSGTNARTDFAVGAGLWEFVSTAYELSQMWDYADYVSALRAPEQLPSRTLTSAEQLASVDQLQHSLVTVSMYNDQTQLDESEIYQLIDQQWVLVEKKNATIQFNRYVWDPAFNIAWDTAEWDVGAWDADSSVHMWYLVRVLREQLFVNQFINNFNTFFFGVIKYAVSQHKQVDWVYKTTYLQTHVQSPVNIGAKKYAPQRVDRISEYIDSVKPFHTKVRSIFDTHTRSEQVQAHISDSWKTAITLMFNQNETPGAVNLADPENPGYHTPALPMNMPVFGGDTVSGGEFTSAPSDAYAGAEFTDSVDPDQEITGGVFLNPTDYNHMEFSDSVTADAARRCLYQADFVEHISIAVQTAYDEQIENAIDTDARTHVYLQDNLMGVQAFSLAQPQSSTLANSVLNTAGEIVLAAGDGAKFQTSGGIAWIAGELIRYAQVQADTLLYVDRGANGTLPKTHESGTVIVDVTHAQLSTINSIVQQAELEYNPETGDSPYITSARFNSPGLSILDTTAETTEAIELQATGAGIDL